MYTTDSWQHAQPCTLDDGDPCDPCHWSAEIAAAVAAQPGRSSADLFAQLFCDRLHTEITDIIDDFNEYLSGLFDAEVRKTVTMWDGKLWPVPESWKDTER